MKKLRLPIKKKKLLLIGVLSLVVLAIGFGLYTYSNNDQSNDGLGDEERKLIAETEEVLKAGAIKHTVGLVTIQEVESSLANKKYSEAKGQLDKLLENENSLTISEKRSAYTALSKVCLPLEDYACVDKVIQFQQHDQLLDYMFIVEAARLAKKQNDNNRAVKYYKLVYDDLESRGGQNYVDEVNTQSQVPLDYQEIKQGTKQ